MYGTGRRMEDSAAQETFEREVQDDRLAQPSSANPNMAQGRIIQRKPSSHNRDPVTGLARRGSGADPRPPTRVARPPDRVVFTQQTIDRMNKASKGAAPAKPAHTPAQTIPDKAVGHYLMLMPLWATQEPRMQDWATAEGLIDESVNLPALTKPYFDIDITRTSLLVRLPPVKFFSKLN